ncbi:MAG: tetratricopeptide repeat protein [Planctomycetota bacterium]
MKQIKLVIAVILMLIIGTLFCGGCQTYINTNLRSTYLLLEPEVKVYPDPDIDWSKYKTFSVFPYQIINKESRLNPIEEKQVLFYVRNQLECLGYTFVEPNKNPDFLVTANFNCEYQEYYIPPQTIILPRYIPGETITTYTNNSGHINTYGDVNMWGTYHGSSTSTTYIPGTMTTETYTQPGYNIGHYYPHADITIYDSKTFKTIWSANGTGTSNNSDFRISGQRVLSVMLYKLRRGSYSNSDSEFIQGCNTIYITCGMFLYIMTTDGINYFPTITVTPDSRAKKAGVINDDIIIQINGESTANKSFFEVGKMFGRSKENELNLKIWRMGKIEDIKITQVGSLKKNPKAYFDVGSTYGRAENYPKAIESYKEAIRLKPDYAEAYFWLGFTYGNLGDNQKAIESYKQVIRIEPDNVKAHFNLGCAYGNLGDDQKVIESFKQVIRIESDNAKAHFNLGFAYRNLGDDQKAIESFKQVIRIEPDNAEAHYNLGFAYGKLVDNQKAIESYKEAIRIKPDYAEAHFCLGQIYDLIGDHQKAIEPYKEVIRLKPDDYLLRSAYLGIKDYLKAIELFKKVIEMNQNDKGIWYNYACALSNNQNIDEAFQALKKAIELGYKDFDWMKKDWDLENLRKDKRFSEIVPQ